MRPGANARRPASWESPDRFATELVAALVVGGGLGWGMDWLFGHFGFHTSPVFLIVFFVLGAAAGIRNVMRAANEINAEMAAKRMRRSNARGDDLNPMEQFEVKPLGWTSRCSTSAAIRSISPTSRC